MWDKLLATLGQANSYTPDVNNFGLSGRPQDANDLSMSDWMDLHKQAGINKNLGGNYPNVSKLASADMAYRNPDRVRGEMYNNAFDIKDLDELNDRYDHNNKMVHLREKAGDRAAGATSKDFIKPKSDDHLVEELVKMMGVTNKPEIYNSTHDHYLPDEHEIGVLRKSGKQDEYAHSLTHELAHAKVNEKRENKLYRKEYFPFWGHLRNPDNGRIPSSLNNRDALALATKFSGDHFNGKYAVPGIDLTASEFTKRIQEAGKEGGYNKMPPEKDPRFDKNKNMVRIMRMLGAQ